MKKLRKIFSSVIAAVLAVFGVGSMMSACTKLSTEIEPCFTEVVLNFGYKFDSDNREDPDPNAPELSDLVDNIQLYVFDRNNANVLHDIVSVSRASIISGTLPVRILSGDYTIVAWGLSSNGVVNGGYDNVQMVDPSTNYYTPVVIGQTRLEEFRTLVIQPENPSFADLYFSIAEKVHIPIPTSKTQIVKTNLTFTSYSNTIRLTINGMDAVRAHIASLKGSTRAAGDTRADISIDFEEDFPLDVYLTGKNGIFTYDGSIDGRAVELTYNHRPISYTETQAVIDLRTLRIDVNRHSVDPMVLHVHPVDAITDAEMHSIVQDIDLLSLIRKVKNDAGEFILDSQNEIDEASVIPIEFTIKREVDEQNPGPDPENPNYHLVITITVVGWQIEDITDISPII